MITDQTLPVTIRPAYADDEQELWRLAALDCARVPTAPVMVAEIEGQIVAAVSAVDLAAVADPFRPTADVVALLRHATTTIEPWPKSTRQRHGSTRLRGRRRLPSSWAASPRFSSARP